MVTLTGEEAAIDRLIARLNADDPTILTRKLALDFAYHSSWFEPVEQHLQGSTSATLDTSPPQLPVISTVTGAAERPVRRRLLVANLRYPVRYQPGRRDRARARRAMFSSSLGRTARCRA